MSLIDVEVASTLLLAVALVGDNDELDDENWDGEGGDVDKGEDDS